MKKITCSKISVDCIKNDPVDVKTGGAEILGYDFFVERVEAERLVSLIDTTIKELSLPLMGIKILEEGKFSLPEEQVWRDERIVQCIIDDSDVIIAEAKRQNVYQK